MARALRSSIAQPANSGYPVLNRMLRRWLALQLHQLRRAVSESAARCGADRYRKHFDSFGHACLLIFHGLSGGQSLRQSYGAFAACPGLVALSGLAPSNEPGEDRLKVSYSQFAASNTSRPGAFLGEAIPSLMAMVRRDGKSPGLNLPLGLHILDSTFLRLSMLLSPWISQACISRSPGVKLQVQYLPGLDLPEHVLLTNNRTNDCQGFDLSILDSPSRLEELHDQTLAFDLGYYSHKRFVCLLKAGVHFVTRLHQQATVQVQEELPVQHPLPNMPTGRIRVLRDQRVKIGSPKNRAGAVIEGLRLVKARVEPLPETARHGAKPVEYRILTDRWDMEAADVIQVYLWRWQIELFFRWLKKYVHISRLLGYSSNAVQLTVWLAIVVHLLSVLAARAMGLARRSPALLRTFIWALSHLTPADYGQATQSHQLTFSGCNATFALPP